ncbi:MAG: hypothetical protein OXL41_04010 [Nitrospinae bacterium]|nr:hypothetical protein [Nitrospinota bacterium]
MSRQPEPRIPFEEDSIHELAETIYADYVEGVLARADTWGRAGALDGLGYKDWIVGGQSYTPPETPKRRAKVLGKLIQKPYYADLAKALDERGFNPPQRDCGKRTAPVEIWFEISDGVLSYGLKETLGRDLMTARYDRMYLKAIDGEEIVAVHTGILSGPNSAELDALGLTDDDYRFELGLEGERAWRGGGAAKPGEGFPRQAEWHDWAIVDGAWKQIGFQGRDWDGEYNGG